MAKKPRKRHFVEIWRPGKALDERGRPTGADDVQLADDVPASIRHTTGAEFVAGEAVVEGSQFEVELVVDPSWGLRARDFLVQKYAGGRRLEINDVRDEYGTEREVKLICGEVV